MRILVLGGGVIGVTTAWYLTKAGHQVTVVERQAGPALETSFANAGQISPGYAAPWAAPGIPFKALAWMLRKHAPLSFRIDGSLYQWRWLWQMLANCNASAYHDNKARMVRLAEYSRDCLDSLRHQTGITYEARQQGTLQIFRTARQFRHAQEDIAVLHDYGVPFELLPPDLLAQKEPALAHAEHRLTGGLYLPHDETGDCQQFTSKLAALAASMGVQFVYETEIARIEQVGDAISAVVTAQGARLVANAYVVALASYSRRLLQGILDIPVYPVKGYSITLPIADRQTAPVSTVLDETYKVAITRFDERIRVGGMAEVAGFDKTLRPARRRTLEMVVGDLFPGAGDVVKSTFWTGLRPMTPDGTPIVGATSIGNLFLNTGHGTLGWTMACGSAQLLADIISGRPPAIVHDDLALGRYT